MKEHYAQIMLIIGGIITTITAWNLGGKQKHRNENTDSITKGTDSLIGSLEKLVKIMEENLQKEVERTQIEREHRDACEKSLASHKKMINELQKEVKLLKQNVNK